MSITAIIKTIPKELKATVKKAFNGPNHAAAYAQLEAFLGEHHCIYEDGTVYAIAKKLAGAI